MFTVAIPNKGSLSEGSIELLREAGYRCKRYSRELVVRDREHAVEFLFLRPRDIAVYVDGEVVDAGITGRDLAADARANVQELLPLGIGRSRFCFAVPKAHDLKAEDLQGKRIATSFPNLVEDWFKARNLEAEIVRLDGAVEISIKLGVADAIADVVESGRTLDEAGLKIIGDPIIVSEAALFSTESKKGEPEVQTLINRLQGILLARTYCLLEYVVSKANLEAACRITPGVKSPTLSPVHDPDWTAVAAMVKSNSLNQVIDDLAALGATGIIAQDIRTCRL